MAHARWVWRTAIAALTITALVGCPKGGSKPTAIGPLPECPEGGMWSHAIFGGDTSKPGPFGNLPGGEIELSRGITDIVEFHDCQQFIVRDSATNALRYSSLFAIFARTHLDSAYVPPPRYAATYDSLTMGTPMATILSFDSTYAALGIEPEFNCLYFFRTDPRVPDAWEARVVPVKRNERACTRPLERTSPTPGTTLTVSVVPRDPADHDGPPPVARWDWDSVSQQQYIGIRCGTAWCEVHPKPRSGAVFSSSVPLPALVPVSKGWYDEQLLAVAHRNTGQPDEVSTIRGTFIPVAGLGKHVGPPEESPFRQHWLTTAHVAVRGDPGFYTSKLNLIESGESVANNEVSLCFVPTGAPNTCVPAGTHLPGCTQVDGWFGRIVHTGDRGETTKYFCVTRRAHDAPGTPVPEIPGTVRWRWAIDDETMWVRCLSGCCEVKAR